MDKNWKYLDTSSLLAANEKYPDLQQRVLVKSQMLLDFLLEGGLLLGGSAIWGSRDINSLTIYASDLTEEGKALFSPPINAYFKWLAANDRDSRKPISMRSLQAGLKKVRDLSP